MIRVFVADPLDITLAWRVGGPKQPDWPTPIFEQGGVGFYARTPPVIEIGKPFILNENGAVRTIWLLSRGWSVEQDFAGSSEREAVLEFRSPTEATKLKLDFGAYLPKGHEQRIEIAVDGVPVGKSVRSGIHWKRHWEIFDMPTKAGERTVTLKFLSPVSPSSVGDSTDPRLLGISLYGVAVE